MPIKQALNKEFKITGNNKKPQILIYSYSFNGGFFQHNKG